MASPQWADPAPGDPERWRSQLLRDLAEILADRRGVYLTLGPKAAVMSVKWPEAFAFGESMFAAWDRMTPRKRAEAFLDWIQRAAEYCRDPKIRQSWARELAV